MPMFSICIPTYNDAEFLPACLDSVLNQDFSDLEVVVVSDGSTDDTADVIAEYVRADQRVKGVVRSENKGPHLARYEATKLSQGRYVLYLDSDDELNPGFLSSLSAQLSAHPVDVLHFGVEVVDCGVGEAEAAAFAGFVNQNIEYLDGVGSLKAAFSASDGGFRQDWRITQRVYEADMLKAAWGRMSFGNLGRAEDAYESFVVLSGAKSCATCNSIVGLKYFYGRGVNSAQRLSVSEFADDAAEFQTSVACIADYARGLDGDVASACVGGTANKLFDLLFNDWLHRVLDADKIAAAKAAARVSSPVICAGQMMRLVRDLAYDDWAQGRDYDPEAPYLSWLAASIEVAGNACASTPSYQKLLATAELHIRDLKIRSQKKRWNNAPARIFVSAHKPVETFDSDILQPVQVGCAMRDQLFSWSLHDNDGENISSQNPMYCELTTQYWAWKNVEAPYIGFCHYRRYFDFTDTPHDQNIYGEIMDDRICAATQARYGLDDASIMRALDGVDIVTTVVQDIRDYMGPDATLRSQYDAADQLHVEDLDRVVKILIAHHPEYEQDARDFLAGHTGCFCNMFIMRNELFRDYCAWLFPILQEFVDGWDSSCCSREGVRTPGHLSERLLNIYLNHLVRTNPELRVKRLQCVHFQRPDKVIPPLPLRVDDPRPVIPVVFASDDGYVPMVTTTVYSALKNASSSYRYDVTILHRNISGDHQRIMREFLSRFENAYLRFVDVSDIVTDYNLSTNNEHISIETYYRFLIQKLLPFYDKVLYLDSDLIVKGDIAELYNVELGDNLLAAAHDIDFVGNVNMKRGDRLDYARDVLGMKDPYAYFQAGVLVLNTRAMREAHSIDEWLTFASDDRFIYNDQDVLNTYCEGRVVFLDWAWNVMIDCGNRIANVFASAPADMLAAFERSRCAEKVVHYAGFQKPWKFVDCDRSDLYWSYCKETPFYEELLAKLMIPPAPVEMVPACMRHEPSCGPDNPLRKIVDPIAPLGSARREVLKSVARAVRGRK